MDLGRNIRRRREQLGLSQMELAKLAEIPQSRISEWESGARTQMSLHNLRSLARALGVSADYLIGTWEDGAAPAPAMAAPPAGDGAAPPRRRGRPRKAAPATPAGATG
jgi:transcriptional regulator with XRE-family HTH domain